MLLKTTSPRIDQPTSYQVYSCTQSCLICYPTCVFSSKTYSGQMESCFERRKSRLHTCYQYQSKKALLYAARCGAMLCLQGYKKRRAFIITQGPMRSTARDFWKMVYSRKCSVVVMLSDLIELDEVANTT